MSRKVGADRAALLLSLLDGLSSTQPGQVVVVEVVEVVVEGG